MMKAKIIITYDLHRVSDQAAIMAVQRVIEAGRISECADRKYFCWITTVGFGNARLQVVVRRDHSGDLDGPDSFDVQRLA